MEDLKAFSVLDAMNIKYLVAPYPMSIPGYKLLSKRPELVRPGMIYLYQNLKVLPREYEISSWRVFADRKTLLDFMFSGNFDPRKEILLEAGPGKCDHLLYVSDTFYPGWKAYVDGKEVAIVRANYMFRAVPLPPGGHTVRFVYDPFSFKLGVAVSLVTLLGLVVFAFCPKGECA